LIVTGVQTCALPIFNGIISIQYSGPRETKGESCVSFRVSRKIDPTPSHYLNVTLASREVRRAYCHSDCVDAVPGFGKGGACELRSEERRVGKECRSR